MLIFLLLATISFFMVRWLIFWLKHSQIFDIPNDRSSHSVPTPRGGGLAIVVLTLLVVLVYAIIHNAWLQCSVYILMGGLVAWLGWQDDIHSLTPKIRFLVQTIVAILTIIFFGYFRFLTIPLIGEVQIGWIGIPLTILWIVGLINAYNFMDGMDGFAGGQALLIAAGWVWISSKGGALPNQLTFWIGIAIAASALGFLPHNWPPASIFMGDVGSTFLGYSFAILPLLSLPDGGNPVLIGVVMLWAIILDTGVTFVRRAIKHENVLDAHRTHLYQRWLIAGVKGKYVNFIYFGFVLLALVLLWGWFQNWPLFPGLIVIGLPLLWLGLHYLTKKREHDHQD